MHVTVCICTRDRGEKIAPTLRSLLQITYEDFDVVVVDQSRDDATERAVMSATAGDGRFQYMRSTSLGLSAARNIAIAHASGPVLAFTDDDCVVSPGWLDCHVALLTTHSRAGLVFGAVRAAPYDSADGYIPDFPVKRAKEVRSRWLKYRDTGIGANMVLRQEALRRAGPFDEMLGAGAMFHAGEDTDMMYRVLRAGYSVLLTPDASVTHFGMRSRQDARGQRKSGWGIGASYMKYVRSGDVAAAYALLQGIFACTSWKRVVLRRKPTGLGFAAETVRGAMVSLRYPLQRGRALYVAPPLLKEANDPTRAQVHEHV
ncbi:MAG: glycosyltransferase family 2 protein [Ktedonobacterales bacterium]